MISFLFLSTTINQIIMSDISSRVTAIIVDKLGVDENEVVATASFTNDLGACWGPFFSCILVSRGCH